MLVKSRYHSTLHIYAGLTTVLAVSCKSCIDRSALPGWCQALTLDDNSVSVRKRLTGLVAAMSVSIPVSITARKTARGLYSFSDGRLGKMVRPGNQQIGHGDNNNS